MEPYAAPSRRREKKPKDEIRDTRYDFPPLRKGEKGGFYTAIFDKPKGPPFSVIARRRPTKQSLPSVIARRRPTKQSSTIHNAKILDCHIATPGVAPRNDEWSKGIATLSAMSGMPRNDGMVTKKDF